MKITRSGPGAAALREILEYVDKHEIAIGIFENSLYADGKPIAGIMAVHEYGSPAAGIPARPVFRPTIQAKAAEWQRQIGLGVIASLDRRTTISKALEAVGLVAAGDVRRYLSKLQTPELAEATVDARRRRSASGEASDKPLVDTGQMLRAITSVVAARGSYGR